MVRGSAVSKVSGASQVVLSALALRHVTGAARLLIVSRRVRGSTSSSPYSVSSCSTTRILADTLATMILRRPARTPSCTLYVGLKVRRARLLDARDLGVLVVAPAKSMAPGCVAFV